MEGYKNKQVSYRSYGKQYTENHPHFAAMLRPGVFAQEAREERIKQARIDREIVALRDFAAFARRHYPSVTEQPIHRGQAAFRVRRGTP